MKSKLICLTLALTATFLSINTHADDTSFVDQLMQQLSGGGKGVEPTGLSGGGKGVEPQ